MGIKRKRVWLHLKNKQTTENYKETERKTLTRVAKLDGKFISFDLNLHTISCG